MTDSFQQRLEDLLRSRALLPEWEESRPWTPGDRREWCFVEGAFSYSLELPPPTPAPVSLGRPTGQLAARWGGGSAGYISYNEPGMHYLPAHSLIDPWAFDALFQRTFPEPVLPSFLAFSLGALRMAEYFADHVARLPARVVFVAPPIEIGPDVRAAVQEAWDTAGLVLDQLGSVVHGQTGLTQWLEWLRRLVDHQVQCDVVVDRGDHFTWSSDECIEALRGVLGDHLHVLGDRRKAAERTDTDFVLREFVHHAGLPRRLARAGNACAEEIRAGRGCARA